MNESWDTLQKRVYNRLLEMHYEANVGHLGGNISCLDILLYLHHYVMRPEDIFILSKGHSAGALYVVLWTLGILDDEQLRTFHKDGGLCGHITSKHGTFSTGSLGHGLPLAVGMAKADQITNNKRQIYCLLSDGELQEGSTQEARNFCNRHNLGNNLKIIIDGNGWQGIDSTETCLDIRPWNAVRYNGHSKENIKRAFDGIQNILWFQTIKGYNTIYENKLESHYWPLTKEQYEASIR
jgi:transketolase